MNLAAPRSLLLVSAFACGGDDGDASDASSTGTDTSTSVTVGPETSGGTDTSSSSSGAADTTTESGGSTGTDTSATDSGSTDASSDGTTGDVLGDCCTAHMGPGCTIPEIQECVCMVDAPCCVGNWDGVCVGDVEKLGCADCTP